MMAEAGTSVAYRAKPAVKAKADCALDFSGLDGVMHLFQLEPPRSSASSLAVRRTRLTPCGSRPTRRACSAKWRSS